MDSHNASPAKNIIPFTQCDTHILSRTIISLIWMTSCITTKMC